MATSKYPVANNPDEQKFKRTGATMISQEALDKLRIAMRTRESSNNYMAVNDLNYVGAYQMGAAALEDLGLLKKGSYAKYGNKAIYNADNWTGKQNVNSLEDFLKDEKTQDDAFNRYAQQNFKTLSRLGTIGASSTADEVAGYIAASHLLGAGAASKSLDAADANNVTGREYFNLATQAINKPTPENVNVVTDELVGVDTRGQSIAPVSQTTIADTGVNITQPIGLPDLTNKEDIKRVQQAIGVKTDGIWGPKSKEAWTNVNNMFVTDTYRQEGMQAPVNINTEPTGLENPFLAVRNWWNSL